MHAVLFAMLPSTGLRPSASCCRLLLSRRAAGGSGRASRRGLDKFTGAIGVAFKGGHTRRGSAYPGGPARIAGIGSISGRSGTLVSRAQELTDNH